MIITDHVDTTLSVQCDNQGLQLTYHTQFFGFTTLYHSNTLVEIGEVGGKATGS